MANSVSCSSYIHLWAFLMSAIAFIISGCGVTRLSQIFLSCSNFERWGLCSALFLDLVASWSSSTLDKWFAIANFRRWRGGTDANGTSGNMFNPRGSPVACLRASICRFQRLNGPLSPGKSSCPGTTHEYQLACYQHSKPLTHRVSYKADNQPSRLVDPSPCIRIQHML